MSRYDELCNAYVAARNEFFQRRERCVAFAAMLMKGFETYIGAPLFQMRFVPHTGDAAAAKTNSPDAAAWLGNDGRWHFLIGLPLVERVQGSNKGGTTQTLRFDLHVAPVETGFNVGVTGTNERFDLPATENAPEHQPFFEFLYGQMARVYQQPGLKFLDNMPDTLRTLHGDR